MRSQDYPDWGEGVPRGVSSPPLSQPRPSIPLPQLSWPPSLPRAFFSTILGNHSQGSLTTLPPPRHRLVGRGRPTEAAGPAWGSRRGLHQLPGFPGLLPKLVLAPSPSGLTTGREVGHQLLLDGSLPPMAGHLPPQGLLPPQRHLGPSLPDTSTLMMASRGRLLSSARLSLSSPVEALSRTRLSSFPRSKL